MIASLLNPRPWLFFGVAFLLTFSGATLLFLKIRTLERDQAVLAREVAEDTLERVRRESILIAESFYRARKADHDRQEFITRNAVAVEKARKDGDGPLAPVLRDALERVRLEYQDRVRQD